MLLCIYSSLPTRQSHPTRVIVTPSWHASDSEPLPSPLQSPHTFLQPSPKTLSARCPPHSSRFLLHPPKFLSSPLLEKTSRSRGLAARQPPSPFPLLTRPPSARDQDHQDSGRHQRSSSAHPTWSAMTETAPRPGKIGMPRDPLVCAPPDVFAVQLSTRGPTFVGWVSIRRSGFGR